MKYLKYFEEASAYEAYKNGSDYVLPNVSYVVENNVVNYNPYKVQETRLVCTYNVTNTTSETIICRDTSSFTSMEVDGVLLDSVTTGYTFDTVGEHMIKFELADPTSIGNMTFHKCIDLASVVIPDSVTTIGNQAISYCTSLTSITIPDSVISIGDDVFYFSTNLNEIICLAITSPNISNNTFIEVKEGGILKVPAGSDYSSWMSTDNYYLGKYNWTIEYI